MTADERDADGFKADESGSFSRFLTNGCLCCREGAKMVLFVTGNCPRVCFFCPLSAQRKNKDVVFANEQIILSDADILKQAREMNAKGTGITGGEPLLKYDSVIHYITLLKNEFGKDHHIHLYTSMAPSDSILQGLAAAGLDEIRFHPPHEEWENLEGSEYEKSIFAAQRCGICAGLEIPAIEGAEKVAAFVKKQGCFLNLNELEFSETNTEALFKRGYVLSDDESNTVKGSAEIAKKAFDVGGKINFCSSRYKDAVQLRLRFLRTAQQNARAFDEITTDGTIAFGKIKLEKQYLLPFVSFLEQMELPADAYFVDEDKNAIETACGIAEELASIFMEEETKDFGKIKIEIVERYPFENGFVVDCLEIY